MIQVRKATLADAGDIARIGRDVFTTTFGHSVSDSDLQAYLDSALTVPLITEELNDAAKDILVAVYSHTPGEGLVAGAAESAVSASASRSTIQHPAAEPTTNGASGSKEGNHCDSAEGIIVGFAQLTRGSSMAEPWVASLEHAASSVELQRLYVDTSYHGKGIGSRLAGSIEDIARREGFTHMWLGVWEENNVAAGLYAKLGYSFIGYHDFAVGSIIQRDDILMKEL